MLGSYFTNLTFPLVSSLKCLKIPQPLSVGFSFLHRCIAPWKSSFFIEDSAPTTVNKDKMDDVDLAPAAVSPQNKELPAQIAGGGGNPKRSEGESASQTTPQGEAGVDVFFHSAPTEVLCHLLSFSTAEELVALTSTSKLLRTLIRQEDAIWQQQMRTYVTGSGEDGMPSVTQAAAIANLGEELLQHFCKGKSKGAVGVVGEPQRCASFELFVQLRLIMRTWLDFSCAGFRIILNDRIWEEHANTKFRCLLLPFDVDALLTAARLRRVLPPLIRATLSNGPRRICSDQADMTEESGRKNWLTPPSLSVLQKDGEDNNSSAVGRSARLLFQVGLLIGDQVAPPPPAIGHDWANFPKLYENARQYQKLQRDLGLADEQQVLEAEIECLRSLQDEGSSDTCSLYGIQLPKGIFGGYQVYDRFTSGWQGLRGPSGHKVPAVVLRLQRFPRAVNLRTERPHAAMGMLPLWAWGACLGPQGRLLREPQVLIHQETLEVFEDARTVEDLVPIPSEEEDLAEVRLQYAAPAGKTFLEYLNEYARRLETGVYGYKPLYPSKFGPDIRGICLFPQAGPGFGSQVTNFVRMDGSAVPLPQGEGFAYSLRFSLTGTAEERGFDSCQLRTRRIDIQVAEDEDESGEGFHSLHGRPTVGPAVIGFHPLLVDGGHILNSSSDQHGQWEYKKHGTKLSKGGSKSGGNGNNAAESASSSSTASGAPGSTDDEDAEMVCCDAAPDAENTAESADNGNNNTISSTSTRWKNLAALSGEDAYFIPGEFSYQSRSGPIPPRHRGRFTGAMEFVPGTIAKPTGEPFWVDVPNFPLEYIDGYAFY
ncbi:unnamed protein product [Amoebophrya sp. A25]|nr:unnamed protein product [Amoebophrya sp. A25]|eukprot:GSA25T00019662001.1